MKYTKLGVPILKDIEIEQKVYELLMLYDRNLLKSACKTPVAGILDFLKRHYDVEIVFANLGFKDNYKILGRTIFSKNTICIDEKIVYDSEPLFLFTSSHEIGHWVLHTGREIKVEESDEVIKQLDDCENDFWGKKILKTPKDWIEHHANVFAACLLMPRPTFIETICLIQNEMGVTRNVGKILLDRQESNQKMLDDIVSHLQNIFGASKQSIIIRLSSLGILIEDKSRRVLHISEIFKDSLKE
jgi:Zn-dependent peptidase ImmA (M78 family)